MISKKRKAQNECNHLEQLEAPAFIELRALNIGSGDSSLWGALRLGLEVTQHVFCSLVSHPSFLAPPLCFPLEHEMIFSSSSSWSCVSGRPWAAVHSWNPKLQIPQALCPPVKTSIVCECHPAAHSGLFSRCVLCGCLFLQGGRTVTVLSAPTINPGYRSGNERLCFSWCWASESVSGLVSGSFCLLCLHPLFSHVNVKLL